jgi:hypothetical protein
MIIKIIFSILIIFSLSSCTRLDFAMRWADRLILWELDDWLDLSSSEKDNLRPEIVELISNAKKNEFPKLADFLDKVSLGLEAKINQPLTVEQVNDWANEGREGFKRATRLTQDMVLKFSDQMTYKQDQAFLKQFTKKTEEHKRNLKDRNKYEKERVVRSFRFWIEDITDEQIDLLRAWAIANYSPLELQIADREKIAPEFFKMDKPKRRVWLTQVFENYESVRSAELNQKWQEYAVKYRVLIVDFWSKLSEKQKLRLIKLLKTRSHQLREFSRKSS